MAAAEDGVELLMSSYNFTGWELSHRVVMAPLTRCRVIERLPNDAHVLYYSQRTTPAASCCRRPLAFRTLPMASQTPPESTPTPRWRLGSPSPPPSTPKAALFSASSGTSAERLIMVVAHIGYQYHPSLAIGMDRVGVKISPTLPHQGSSDSDPLTLALAIARALNSVQDEASGHISQHAFLHFQLGGGSGKEEEEVMRAVRGAYKGTFMVCGGYPRDSGAKVVAKGDADLIAYGRLFVSNPDLVDRFKLQDVPLNSYDPFTFCTYDPVVGYTDYPFLGSH